MSTTMNTNALRLRVSGQSGFRFDSVSVHARSLDAAKSTTYAYNTSNQLTSSVTNGTTTNYTYDAWGRLLTRSAGSYTATHTYRYGDKLKHVASSFPGDTANVAYNYDGLGRRRNRMANGVTPITWWRYGLGWDTVAEYTDNDTDWAVEGFSKFNVMTDFMHPLAEATVASGQTPANAAYSYLALDHLSSTRGVFSQTKTQTGTMEFLPYGARHTATGTLPHHQFTAKPYDTGTGLYTFPYRHYSPAMARWTGADPAGIVNGPNVYGYVNGGATIMVDPLGLLMKCYDTGKRRYETTPWEKIKYETDVDWGLFILASPLIGDRLIWVMSITIEHYYIYKSIRTTYALMNCHDMDECSRITDVWSYWENIGDDVFLRRHLFNTEYHAFWAPPPVCYVSKVNGQLYCYREPYT